MTPTSVWLVTPAHRRFDLSEVCFAQHAWVASELAKHGIAVTSCVVADDHNLVLARRHGFATVKRKNDYLGARWNDGYQFAAAEHADFIVPLGSDSWIHPSFFDELPEPRGTDLLTGRFYAIVNEDGDKMARLSIKIAGGVGPNVVPTWLLGAVGWRPVGNTLARGCDGSLLRSLQSAHDIAFKWRNLDPLQYVGFKSHGEQINSYEHLAERYGGGECSPWEVLPAMYPADLVDAARAVYKARGSKPERARAAAR